MRYLIHESGEATELRNSQVMGDESPLSFDEDGRAGPLEDDVAEKVAAMHRHVTLGKRGRESDTDEDEEAVDEDVQEDDADEFDAEAFVDRTPIDDVVEDLESGEYDDHLDAIEAAADRVGVQGAIDERKE